MTVTLKCCQCDLEATATGGTEALVRSGWLVVYHCHCSTCECFDVFCPAHKALADASQTRADQRSKTF